MAVEVFRNEPFINFQDPHWAEQQRQAIEAVTEQFGQQYPLRIGGEAVWTERRIRSVSPWNASHNVGEAASAGAAEAEQALQAAAKAFPAWSRTAPEARARILLKAAAAMRRRRLEFNAWAVLELGKTWVEADVEVAEGIDFLEYYARQMLDMAGPQPLSPWSGEENHLHYIPLGVGVVHSPFNFAIAIMAGMTASAVVTGNTVVVKPSVHAPIICAKFFEVLAEAGLPPGVAQYLPGDPADIGDVLTVHPLVRFINFTGSAAVGAMLAEKAARMAPGQRFLRRFIAEMGGKDAIVVADDADLDAAAEGIVASAFGYSGQKCSACSRAIVDAKVYDEVLEKVVRLTAALKAGEADAAETQLSPVISAAARDRILGYIETGKSEGRLAAGGGLVDGTSELVIAPTIFADIAPDARLAQEEIFGPVLAFIKARDYDHALEIANGTDYGLTGAVYTTSRDRLEQARQEFHVGNLYFNRKCTGALVGVQPFGGFNMSGTCSKAGGPDYLRLFVQAKAVAERL